MATDRVTAEDAETDSMYEERAALAESRSSRMKILEPAPAAVERLGVLSVSFLPCYALYCSVWK